ncbi:MAG: heme-binding domain-containing protein [Bacteroidales bacterium]
MKWLKGIAIIAIVALVGIQFIPISRNMSKDVPSTDFILTFQPTENVANILKTSCYDCHSNNTDYPWYSHIQPVGLLLENDISDGKENLNLSEFGTYSARKQISKLTMMMNQIEDKKMPLPAYTFMHHNAKLSMEDKKAITGFLESLKDSISFQ